LKVSFSFQNNNSLKSQKQNITFEAGLTPKMIQEIQQAEVLKISKKLAQKGIPTDFKDNKVIAWCSEKTIEILEQLNKKYKLKLALPKGVYLEDFANLNVDDSAATGFCNSTRTVIRKISNEETPPKTIFFNTFESIKNTLSEKNKYLYSWDSNDLDKAADTNYATKFMPTDHFLNPFLHELMTHVLHIENLQKKIGGKAIVEKIESFKDIEQIKKINDKYESKLSQICRYALTNPMEAVACDMTKVIADSLDKETLMPTRNPFVRTPYERLSFWQRADIPNYPNEERPLKEILRNFWNGNFD